MRKITTAAFAVGLLCGAALLADEEPAVVAQDTPITMKSLSLNIPTSYEQQKASGFKPRSDLAPWPLNLPLDWAADPFKDRNWRFHLHALRMTDPIIDRYSKTGDAAYLDEAMTFVRDWYNFHLVEGKTAAFSWYDMASGLRAMRLAFLEEQIATGKWNASSEDRGILRQLAAVHATRLQEEKFINLGNHGLFQTVGLDMLCQEFSDLKECANGRDFAAKMYGKIAGNQFTEEGIHRENSPQYHRFALTAIENVGGADRFNLPDLRRKLDLAKKAWPYLVFPDGNVVRVGDSEGRGVPLKEPDKGAVKLENGEEFSVRDWSKSGYIVIRSNPPQNDSMLFVTGMNHVLGHKHADNLSFELFEHGRQIFVDSGKYSYNKNAMRNYIKSAAAHNTISLLDTPQKPDDVRLEGSSLKPLEATSSAFVVRGSADFPELQFKQDRVITYRPGKSLTVADTVVSKSPRKFVSTLVLPPDLAPTMTGRGFELVLANGKKIAASVRESCTVESVRGQSEPPLGWVSYEYLKIEPTTVVRAICDGPTITWDIDLDAAPA